VHKAIPGLKTAYLSARKKDAVLNMRIPVELRKLVKARARKESLSLACYVRLVLEEAVTDEQVRRGPGKPPQRC
jgi:predicted DNA binding CopG/RHH family protein